MRLYTICHTDERGITTELLQFGPVDSYYKDRGCFPYQLYDNSAYCYIILREQYKGTLSYRPYKDPEWRAREEARLARGEYTPLPWSELTPVPDHYAHVSVDNGAMVAFTPNEEKGMIDVQTRMKPGRYLTKFYPHLSSDTVRAMALALDKAVCVRFATTADDIEKVYTNGPHSCMAYSAHHFRSDVHPCRAYAGGDLQLAYLSLQDLDHSEFRASARALVWPEKKLYGRAYGDEIRLKAALEAMGYEEADWRGDGLDGARISHLETDDSDVIMPYVDGHHNLRRAGQFWVIDMSGPHSADRTDGMLEEEEEEEGEYCAYYEEVRDENSVYIWDLEEYWCETAAGRYATYCHGHHAYMSDANNAFHEVYGSTYSEDWLQNNASFCEGDGEWTFETTVWVRDTEQTVSEDYARRNNYWQNEDGEWYSEVQPDPNQLELELDAA